MFELILFIALGEPGEIDRQSTAIAGTYETMAECDAARWAWWQSARAPEGYDGWFQIMPGECASEPLLS